MSAGRKKREGLSELRKQEGLSAGRRKREGLSELRRKQEWFSEGLSGRRKQEGLSEGLSELKKWEGLHGRRIGEIRYRK